MKHIFYRLFAMIGATALVASVSTTGFTQESDDAMDDFMNAPADEAPPATDAVGAGADVVDMRLKGAADVAAVTPVQANPALDKIEALMIAEAEMKVFMKSGGLRSRKIK